MTSQAAQYKPDVGLSKHAHLTKFGTLQSPPLKSLTSSLGPICPSPHGITRLALIPQLSRPEPKLRI